MNGAKIHWVRAVIGGFLAEAALFVVVLPVYKGFGQHPLLYVAPAGSLVMCFLSAMWVGRRLEGRLVLHGILVGVVATLIYVALTRAQPEPTAYIVAHGMKILGAPQVGALLHGDGGRELQCRESSERRDCLRCRRTGASKGQTKRNECYEV